MSTRSVSPKPIRCHLLGVAALCLSLAMPAQAAGRLDPLFGIGGRQVVRFDVAPDFADQGLAMAAQADGRLVLVGPVRTENDRFSVGVARLTVDGQLDGSFGQGGTRVQRDAAGQFLVPFAAAVQADDRIIVTGARYPTQPVAIGEAPSGSPATIEWFVMRFLANGSGLDSSFGIGGIVLLNIAGDQEYGTAVAIQSDGRIVLAGTLDSVLVEPRMAAVRLLASGALDTSFAGGDGLFDEVFAASYDRSLAHSVTVQSDGRILLGGAARKAFSPFDEDMALIRLLSNGSVDGSFGGTPQAGRAIVDFSLAGLPRDDRLYAMAYRRELVVLGSRRIVVGGQVEPNSGPLLAALAVLDYSGTLDPGFSGDGKVEFSSGFIHSRSGVYSIALERIDPLILETSDRISFGGILPNVIGAACFAGRLNFAGSPDLAFNGGNLLSLRVSPASVKDECRGGLLRDERYFLVGTHSINMTMTGDDFSAFAVLSGGMLFRDGFETQSN